MKRFVIAGAGVLALVAVIAAAASQATLSALPEPGRLETSVAAEVKHYLVHRSSQEGTPPAPANRQMNNQGRREAVRYGMRGMPRSEWAQSH